MLVLDGHGSHQSVGFEDFCKHNNIIPICLPPHSSHLTQPLDVGFFSPLKKAYGKEIGIFIRAHINHITKVKFFLAFHAAYNASISKENIAGGFRGAGLIPFDSQAVISKLDVKLRALTPTEPSAADSNSWVSQTPHNLTEAISQSKLVKSQINDHRGSSPAPIFLAVKQMVKGIEVMAHSVTLLTAENRNLQKANEALSKRRRAKKTRVRQGGALTVEDAQDILAQKDAEEQVARDRRENRDGDGERRTTVRRCGNCGETGHNARTCQVEAEMSDVYSSDSF
jgi:DDE superfamily endonuclease